MAATLGQTSTGGIIASQATNPGETLFLAPGLSYARGFALHRQAHRVFDGLVHAMDLAKGSAKVVVIEATVLAQRSMAGLN